MNHRLLLATLLGLGLLSTTGASLPYPLLAPLFADGTANGLNTFLGLPPKLLLGIALMVNPIGLLIGTAVLGPLSDSFGRRGVLLLTTLGAAVGHFLSAVALTVESYGLFLVARFVTGLLEGNGAVMRAIIIERIQGPLRNHALSWLNGALHLGWLVGPLLAGFSMAGGITLPFNIAAGLLVLGGLCAAFALPGGAPQVASPQGWWAVARERHAFTLLRHLPLRRLFGVHFAYACGVAAMYEFFPLWLVDVGGYDAARIALVNTGLCALMTGAAVFAGRASSLDGRHRAGLHAGAAAVAILCVGLGGLWLGVLAIILFGVPNAYYNATLQAWSADQFAEHGQGGVMALLSTTFYLATMVVAGAGAVLTLIDTRAILIAGGLMAAWAALSLRRWGTQAAFAGMEKP